MEITRHKPGMFSWADLATPNGQASKDFYTQLLELDATEVPVGEGFFYVMLSKRGRNACAIYEMGDEMKQQTGGHSVWQTYFTVKSVDDTVNQIKKLGGTLFGEPFDVFDAGRMVVAQDPAGAVFAVWEPRKEIGAQVFGEPGALGWTELYTHDTEAASTFYSGLFGWSTKRRPGTYGDEYIEFQIDGESAAGMMAIKKEWGEMPANWAIYFVVASLEGTMEKAKGIGARQVMPPIDVEGVGRAVFLQDPQGAYVAFIQMGAKPGVS